MLYLPKTSLIRVVTRPIVSGGVVNAEGACLISNVEAGLRGVTQSNGASGEVFAGLAIYERAPLINVPKVEEGIVDDTTFKVALLRVPVGGAAAMRVVDLTTNTLLTAGSAANAGEFELTGSLGNEVLVHTSRADHQLRVFYRFSPTNNEARQLQGDVRAGGTALAAYGRTGAILIGDVYTTEFDLTVDWNQDNLVPRTGANGRITLGGNGAVIPGTIISAPTVESPFLGISLT
jgi:hypothetical protein